MSDFYDQLSPFYHLIFQDWDTSLHRQGEQLSGLVAAEWPGAHKVLDVACGIGTQALALAQQGYAVTASDLSSGEIARAKVEAQQRGLSIAFSVCDMQAAHDHHGTGFDVVICADNSLPHLLTDDDILIALRAMLACCRAGGGCILSVRDYAQEERGRNLVKPYPVRVEGGKRYVPLQIWDFEGEHYDLSFVLIEEDLRTGVVQTQVMRTRYYAVSTDKLCTLMRQAGFCDVKRLDGVFYQPLIVGHRPNTA